MMKVLVSTTTVQENSDILIERFEHFHLTATQEVEQSPPIVGSVVQFPTPFVTCRSFPWA